MNDPITLLRDFGYVGLFLTIFFESCLVIWFPGDSLLFAVGVLASTGFFSLHLAIAITVLAAIFGGHLGYFLGTKISIAQRWPLFRKIIRESQLEKAKNFFTRYGGRGIIFARFVPVVRTLTPLATGFLHYSRKKFAFYNMIGAFIWSLSLSGSGYLFGRTFPNLLDRIDVITLTILAVSFLPLIISWLRKSPEGK